MRDAVCRDLDDTMMAKIMAHKNMEEWAWFAEGRIKLPKVTSKEGGAVRFAPSFIATSRLSSSGRPEELVYCAATLAEFLKWKPFKVENVLNALSIQSR